MSTPLPVLCKTSSAAPLSRRKFLTAAGLSGMLAACSRPYESTPATSQPERVAGTVDFWLPADPIFEELFGNRLIPAFQEAYPKVSVAITPVTGGWDVHYEKLLTAVAGGVPPDVTRGKEFWTADLAYRGALENLDPWLKRQKEVTPERYHPAVWGISRWRDGTYGIPLHYFIRHLFFNLTVFEEVGLFGSDGKPLVPNTWQEYHDLARKLSDPTKQRYGTELYNYGRSEDNTSHFQYFLTSAGGTYVNAERTKYTFNSTAGIETLTFFVEMIRSGACRPPTVSIPNAIPTGKIAMWFTGAFSMPSYDRNYPDLRYGLALMPKNKSRGVVVRGNNLFLFSGSKQKEAAFRFMTFMARDDMSYIYTTTTGYPPTTKANEGKEPYSTDPRWKIVLEQAAVKENIFQPFFPGYVEGALLVAEELAAAYKGEKTPKDALADAEKRATEVLIIPK
jgi:multiple sugar transport system substrate-binding protein